jgi:hypothetical protein
VKLWHVILFVVTVGCLLLGLKMMHNSRTAACAQLGGTLSSSQDTCLSDDGRILDIY